jgi:peptide/nickel transport system ATP-binding protein
MASVEPVLAIEGLSVSFGATHVLRDVALDIRRGEVFGLVGESGSGKSTLLFAVMNYLPPGASVDAGTIRFEDKNLLGATRGELDRVRGRRIAMVYQDPGSAFNPSLRVGVQVDEVRRRHFGESPAAARAETLKAFRTVGLDDPERMHASFPHQLSGGQRQRAMIAMAIAGAPEILLMDEPTTALDVIVQARILELVRSLKEKLGVAVLFVSHDLGAVAQVADRIGVLYAGELMEVGAAKTILRGSRNPYTRGLLAAIPRVDQRTALAGIPGTASRAPDRFSHCVFAGRCGLTAAICRAERPGLVAVAPAHRSRCHFAASAALLETWPPATDRAHPPAPTATGRPLLEVEHLHVEYRSGGFVPGLGGKTVRAVEDVSFALAPERVLAVVGESGSGKTTLARTLLRLERAKSGRAVFDGEEVFSLGADPLRTFRRRVQIVFQNPTSSLNPRKRVLDLVARPLRLGGLSGAASTRRAADTLASVGLDATFHRRFPHELSGGEKQRVALARAFATGPALVILDEPTTALDVSVQATVLALLQELRRIAGCAYLLITHDLAVVRHIADDVIVMRGGEVCESGPVRQIFNAPQHPYTRALIEAVPRID